MCTVLLRLAPGADWPLVLAAVRDEFADRAWDPPAAHWPEAAGVIGGRDRVAGGTWLAVSPSSRSVAALLNGVRLPPPAAGVRPSRGALVLAALNGTAPLSDADLAGYDGFHLLLGTPDAVTVWSWDGAQLAKQDLTPGDHIVVNLGVDTVDDPLVPHFAPLFAAVPTPASLRGDTAGAWGGWVGLLDGDGLAGDDDRALIVRRSFDDRVYGSGSAALIALGPGGARFDFTATPATPNWYQVDLGPEWQR